MKKTEIKPLRLKIWFQDLDEKKILLFEQYYQLLVKYNSVLNLVSPKTLDIADLVHFSDAIMGSKLIYEKGGIGQNIYDFGSGNGFPGIVFAILFPHISVILIEGDTRKSEFLKTLVTELKLTNVSVNSIAIESLPENSVDFAVSRGLANLSKSLLLTRKLFKKDGKYFHFKTEEWAREAAEIPIQLCAYWHPELLGVYTLPEMAIKYAIVKTTKIK